MLPLDVHTRHGMENNQFIKKAENIPKKLVFVRAGSIAEHACFLEHGFATAYRKSGDTWVVSWFKTAPCGIIPENFFTGDCCGEKIVISAGSTIVYICRKGIEELFKDHPRTQEFIWLIQEKHLHETEEEKMLLRKLSDEEKYRHMMVHRPEVIHRAPVKDLGSYLGIRLRQFYNIRKKLKKG